MKKTVQKPKLLVELTAQKIEAQKTGASAKSFGNFMPRKARNVNGSSVGPSWGGRKGN